MTLSIPDDLASRLRPLTPQLPHILELGIREWNAQHHQGFSGLADVLEKLAALPAPAEVMALRPSDALQARITELLEKNRSSGLSSDEQAEWQRYEYVEHLVRLAKARARFRLERKPEP
jgi:hypothetical protein